MGRPSFDDAARRARSDRRKVMLGSFLEQGPDGGTWEIRDLGQVRRAYVAPHPIKAGTSLMAWVTPDGPKPACALSRWLVPRQFFKAPGWLFFQNYHQVDEAVEEKLADGTLAVRVRWLASANAEALTERRVWHAKQGGEVVQIEDRSRTGHVIKRVRRLAKDTGDWDPTRFDAAELERCEVAPPTGGRDAKRELDRVVDQAPFPVYMPAYTPPGFNLLRAKYREIDVGAPGEGGAKDAASAKHVQMASLLFSDGMALISIAMSPTPHMDVIERQNAARMSSTTADGEGCPGLEREPRKVRSEGKLVRLRSDTCRTVMRRDDLGDVSVTVLGRNELSAEQYLRVIQSLEPLE